MRAMARRPDGSEQALVEVKGVDAAYPLVGRVCALRRHVARRCHPPRARCRHRSDPARAARPQGRRPPLARQDRRCRSAPPSRPSPTSSPSASPSARACSSRSRRCSAPGLIDPGSLVGWRYALKLDGGAGETDRGLVELPRARQAGAARGRLHRARPARSFAAGVAHARAAAPVPDAGRPHRAAGRRRRRRQCGRHLHRPPPQGDRRLQEPRRHQPHDLRRCICCRCC